MLRIQPAMVGVAEFIEGADFNHWLSPEISDISFALPQTIEDTDIGSIRKSWKGIVSISC
ncbi:hypothetical protein AA0473_1878 [Acetobacter orleanensis NRIC 0473]|nr:hypothetical protein AA0473_1878 [Acetobacter orleanensis NRIC 0473]